MTRISTVIALVVAFMCFASAPLSRAAAEPAAADAPVEPAPAQDSGDSGDVASPSDPAPAAEATPPSDQQIEAWIKQLDSDTFADRERATQQLIRAAQAALPHVAKAAESTSLETVSRAMEVLRQHRRGDDEALRSAADKVLHKLAESENAVLAQRATKVLEEQAPKTVYDNLGDPFGNPFGGGFRPVPLRIVPGAANVVRIQVRAAGGDKSVEVEQDGKKIKISETKDGIEVSQTEKVDGKEVTKTYKAKDKAELKEKEPEGYKLYEKYGQGGLGGAASVRIIGGFGGGAGGIRIAPPKLEDPALDRQFGAEFKRLKEEIERAQELHQEEIEQLRKHLKVPDVEIEPLRPADVESKLKGLKEEIERARKVRETEIEQLNRRLQVPDVEVERPRIVDIESQLKELRERASKLQAENEKLKAKVERLQEDKPEK